MHANLSARKWVQDTRKILYQRAVLYASETPYAMVLLVYDCAVHMQFNAYQTYPTLPSTQYADMQAPPYLTHFVFRKVEVVGLSDRDSRMYRDSTCILR